MPQLRAIFRFLLCPLLIASVLVQCKKTDDPVVTPTTPVTPPVSTTTAPPLTDQAVAKTGVQLTAKDDYEKLPIYVAKGFKGGRLASITRADFSAEIPPIGDQGQQGSCNGWASAYTLRSYLYHQDTKKSYILANGNRDDEVVFSPAYVYNQINKGKDEGSTPYDAYTLMVREGVCTYKDMPYQATNPGYLTQPTIEQKQKAGNYKIAGFGRTLITTASLKAVLAQGTAVAVSVRVDQNFRQPTDKVGSEFVWKTFDAATNRPSLDNHAVVLVGFDDTKNAFKIMNSWGTSWANQGFLWLDYNLLNQVVSEAYIPYTTSTFAQLAVYDPSAVFSGTGTWTQKADCPLGGDLGNGGQTTFVIDNIIYTCGTVNSIDKLYAYNPATNQWVQKAIPKPNQYGSGVLNKGLGAFTINGKAYVVTGTNNVDYGSSRNLYMYDPATDTWTQRKDIPFDNRFARETPATFSYNGKGYFGLSASSLSIDSQDKNKQNGELWEYNPADDSWIQKSQIPTDWIIGDPTAYGVINNKLYLAYHQSIRPSVSGATLVYEYDLVTNTWAKKQYLASVPDIAIGGVLNNKLYGGILSSGATSSNTNRLFAYDPSTDKWTEVNGYPKTGLLFRARNSAVVNNKLYIGNGYKSTGGKVGEWWEYTP